MISKTGLVEWGWNCRMDTMQIPFQLLPSNRCWKSYRCRGERGYRIEWLQFLSCMMLSRLSGPLLNVHSTSACTLGPLMHLRWRRILSATVVNVMSKSARNSQPKKTKYSPRRPRLISLGMDRKYDQRDILSQYSRKLPDHLHQILPGSGDVNRSYLEGVNLPRRFYAAILGGGVSNLRFRYCVKLLGIMSHLAKLLTR